MKFKLFYSKSKSKTDLRSKHLADLMCVVNWLIIIYRSETKFLLKVANIFCHPGVNFLHFREHQYYFNEVKKIVKISFIPK